MASGLMVIRITRGGDIFALQLQPQEIAIAWWNHVGSLEMLVLNHRFIHVNQHMFSTRYTIIWWSNSIFFSIYHPLNINKPTYLSKLPQKLCTVLFAYSTWCLSMAMLAYRVPLSGCKYPRHAAATWGDRWCWRPHDWSGLHVSKNDWVYIMVAEEVPIENSRNHW